MVQVGFTLFLGLVLEVYLVGAEDCVPNGEEGRKVTNVVAVVEVVILGTARHGEQSEYTPTPFIAAVAISCLPHSDENPHNDG